MLYVVSAATACYSACSTRATALEEEGAAYRCTIPGHRTFREGFFPELNIRKINLWNNTLFCIICLNIYLYLFTKLLYRLPYDLTHLG